MTEMIRVRDLKKNFKVVDRQKGLGGAFRNLFAPVTREIRAVDGINFSMNAGELVGYLGPNGAGKSTTIKMLTGLLVPSSGEIRVANFVPWKDRTRYVARIGCVFGQRTTLWWDLPVEDSFDLLKDLYRIPADQFSRNLNRFREILDMDEFLRVPVRSLSLGQRMRAELCAALLHEPPLLFLDEPTIGLDVVAKERIREFIQYIHQERGTTIILTTHDLTDVERLCERVMIIDHGVILYDGFLRTLIERFEPNRIAVITMSKDYPNYRVEGLAEPVLEGGKVLYSYDPRKMTVVEVMERLNGHFEIADLEIRRPDIEVTIRRIYEEKLLLQGDGV